MKTDTIEAWQVEKDDVISLGGGALFTVAEVKDEGGSLSFLLTDDTDGETEEFFFTPDEDVTLVVSLEDE